MRERFLEIRKKIEDKVEEFLRITLETPPSYEEAVANFMHASGCSQTKPLAKVQSSRLIDLHPAGVMSFQTSQIEVTLKYVECPECRNSVRYSG